MNQQIKDLEERLDKIKKELESLKQPDYLNKWVVNTYNSILYITELHGLKCNGYGFGGGTKQWIYNGTFELQDIERLATNQEVEEMLKNEAIKRGFKEGVRFECLYDGTKSKKSKWVENAKIYFTVENGEVWINGINYYMLCIFKDGVWAEIINKKKMTLKEVEQELGYEIELI